MVPSSFMISTSTPRRVETCSLARSMVASGMACPAEDPAFFWRVKGRYVRACPGLQGGWPDRSALVQSFARSLAEIPVVQPWPSRSTDTVKGVSAGGVIIDHETQPQLVATALFQRGANEAPPVFAHEIDHPRGVTLWAAVMKSPSFSLSSSSTTITSFPCFISSMALSILASMYRKFNYELSPADL